MKTVVAQIAFAVGESEGHRVLLENRNWTMTGRGEWQKRFPDEAQADSEAREVLKLLRAESPCAVSATRNTVRVTES